MYICGCANVPELTSRPFPGPPATAASPAPAESEERRREDRIAANSAVLLSLGLPPPAAAAFAAASAAGRENAIRSIKPNVSSNENQRLLLIFIESAEQSRKERAKISHIEGAGWFLVSNRCSPKLAQDAQ